MWVTIGRLLNTFINWRLNKNFLIRVQHLIGVAMCSSKQCEQLKRCIWWPVISQQGQFYYLLLVNLHKKKSTKVTQWQKAPLAWKTPEKKYFLPALYLLCMTNNFWCCQIITFVKQNRKDMSLIDPVLKPSKSLTLLNQFIFSINLFLQTHFIFSL